LVAKFQIKNLLHKKKNIPFNRKKSSFMGRLKYLL